METLSPLHDDSLFPSSPSPWQSPLCLSESDYSQLSCKWSPAVLVLLRLASFTYLNVLTVHPCCSHAAFSKSALLKGYVLFNFQAWVGIPFFQEAHTTVSMMICTWAVGGGGGQPSREGVEPGDPLLPRVCTPLGHRLSLFPPCPAESGAQKTV